MRGIFGLFFSTLICLSVVSALQSCSMDEAAVYPTYKNYHAAPQRTLLNVASYQQTTNYTCAPASVMSLLHYYGKLNSGDMNKTTEMRIAGEMGTSPTSGTSQQNMVAWLEKHGFSVQSGQGANMEMLIQNLQRGTPTLIVWNDWNGHSIMVIGHELNSGNKDVLYFADPSSTSSVTDNGQVLRGINTLTTSQLESNWVNAENFFNPGHIATGTYVIATPRN